MFKGHTGIDESTIRLERVNPYTDEVELERDCGQGRDGRILISNDRIVLASPDRYIRLWPAVPSPDRPRPLADPSGEIAIHLVPSGGIFRAVV